MRKKLFVLGILLLLVFALFAAKITIPSQKLVLPYDGMGNAMQLSKSFVTVSDSIPAQAAAVYDSVAVPTKTVEVVLLSRHQAVYIRKGTRATPAATSWIYVPKDTPFRLPVMDVEYICYKSATGAASLQITWFKL